MYSKYLSFNCTKDNVTFSVIIRPFFTNVKYIVKSGNYEGEIDFHTSNYLARVRYKNYCFSGKINSRSNWRIRNCNTLDTILICKNNVLSTGAQEHISLISINEKSNIVQDINILDIPEISILYNDILIKHEEIYKKITDKELFNQQLINYLYENADLDLDNYSNVIGYTESYYDNGFSCREELIENCVDLFKNFYSGEKDQQKLSEIITIDNLLSIDDRLNDIDEKSLNAIFNNLLSDNVITFELKDIFYNQEDFLFYISNNVFSMYEKQKKEKIISNINKKLKNINYEDEDINIILNQMLSNYNKIDISSNTSVDIMLNSIIGELDDFNKRFNSIVATYGDKNITFNFDNESNSLNDIFINNKLYFSERNVDESIRIILTDLYKKHLWKKDSTELRSIIKDFPKFIEFAAETISSLIDRSLLNI